MNHAIKRQEELKANILKMYSNKEQLTSKEMSIEEFQKSYPVEQFNVVTCKIMESYCKESVEKIKTITDKIEKSAFVDKVAADINSHESVIVKAENGVAKKFFVKKKEEAAAAK